MKVIFSFQGTQDETFYYWSFGDGSEPIRIKGLDKAAIISHTYMKKGSYNISVKAENTKGSATANLHIHVEGTKISNILHFCLT